MSHVLLRAAGRTEPSELFINSYPGLTHFDCIMHTLPLRLGTAKSLFMLMLFDWLIYRGNVSGVTLRLI